MHTIEHIEWIMWSDNELAFITNLGHTFKKYNHIPEEYRHLVHHLPPKRKRNRKQQAKNNSHVIKHYED